MICTPSTARRSGRTGHVGRPLPLVQASSRRSLPLERVRVRPVLSEQVPQLPQIVPARPDLVGGVQVVEAGVEVSGQRGRTSLTVAVAKAARLALPAATKPLPNRWAGLRTPPGAEEGLGRRHAGICAHEVGHGVARLRAVVAVKVVVEMTSTLMMVLVVVAVFVVNVSVVTSGPALSTARFCRGRWQGRWRRRWKG